MRRRWLWWIAGAVGLAAAAAFAGWYILSSHMLEATKARVASANTMPMKEGSHLHVDYARLRRAPFPVIGVYIDEPVIEFSSRGDEVHPPLTIRWQRHGYVAVTGNPMTRQYRLISDGAGSTRIDAGDTPFALTSVPSRIELVLTAADKARYEALQTLDIADLMAVRTAISELAAISLTTTAMQLTDSSHDRLLYGHESVALTFTQRPTAGHYDFDATLRMEASQVTPDYSQLLAQLADILQLPVAINDEIMPFSSVRAGKQDIDMSVRVDIPQNAQDEPIDQGYIHAERLQVQNDYFRIDAPFSAVIGIENERRVAKVTADLQFELLKAGGEEMQRFGMNSAVMTIAANYAGAERVEGDTDQLQEALIQALPNLSSLGPIRLKAQLEASVPLIDEEAPAQEKPEHSDASGETLTLDTLSLTHARWGIEAKGMVARRGGEGVRADFTVLCHACETLTRDSYDVAQATQSLLNLLNPAREQWYLNEEMYANLLQTLKDIGRNDPANGDIVFGIGSPEANDIRINDKPIGEVIPRLMSVFLPPEEAKKFLPPAQDDASEDENLEP